MDELGGASPYIRGKQIMPVDTFVKEIENLRIGSKAHPMKLAQGPMLPIVLIKKVSPALIRRKKREALGNFRRGGNLNRIYSSSEEEESQDEDPPHDNATDQTPIASKDTSSKRDYRPYMTDEESLPDIDSEDNPRDMTYKDNSPKEVTSNSLKLRIDLKNKKSKKVSRTPSTDAKLMKSARDLFLQKRKMFSGTDKDKRAKTSNLSKNTSTITKKVSVHEPPQQTSISNPSAQTGVLRNVVEENPSHESIDDEERARQELIKRARLGLKSPPSKEKGTKNENTPLSSPKVKADLDDISPGYASDETVIYDEFDKKNLIAKSVPENKQDIVETQESQKKYVADDVCHETLSDPNPIVGSSGSDQNFIVASSPSFIDEDCSMEDAVTGIVIQQVQGGVNEAFENSATSSNDYKNILHSSKSTPDKGNSVNINQLKQSMCERENLEKKMNEEREFHSKQLKKAQADYEKAVAAEDKRHKRKMEEMEETKIVIQSRINVMLNEPDAKNSNEVKGTERSLATSPLLSSKAAQNSNLTEESQQPLQPPKSIKIIDGANISKFGKPDTTTSKAPSSQTNPSSAKRHKSKKTKSSDSPDVIVCEDEVPRKTSQPEVSQSSGNVQESSQPSAFYILQPSSNVIGGQPTHMPPFQASANVTITGPPNSIPYPAPPNVTMAGPTNPMQYQAPPNFTSGDQPIVMQGPQARPPPPPYYQAKGRTPNILRNVRGPKQTVNRVSGPRPGLSQEQMQMQPTNRPMQGINQGLPHQPVSRPIQGMNQGFSGQIPGLSKEQKQVQDEGLSQRLQQQSLIVVLPSGNENVMFNAVQPPSYTNPGVMNQHPSVVDKNPTLNTLLSQRNQVSQGRQSYMVGSNGSSTNASQNFGGIQAHPTSVNNVAQVNTQQRQMPHLVVAAQPTVLGGLATQAKAQPANRLHPAPSGSSSHGFGMPSSSNNGGSKIPVFQSREEESTPSPEAEQSCFLCGSPEGTVCCNSIVYCSDDCKKKDWSRHKSECTNNNRG